MLKIKSIRLDNLNQVSLLFDDSNALPCLYPMLYIHSVLKYKSDSTQQSYLQGIKQWYEFWQDKYHESFCTYFYKNKSNPHLMLSEIDGFLLYLENDRLIDNKLTRLGVNTSTNYNTLSQRLRALLSYLDYLLDNFTYIHGKPRTPEINRYKSLISKNYEIIANLTSKHYKAHKTGTNFKSLTEEMRNALYTIISPKSELSLFESNEVQYRNFIIVHLLLNYGLRTSELLLLTLNSIKKDSKSDNTYLVIFDTQDKNDSRKNKPHIKNIQSNRQILLDKIDANLIHIYIERIRYKQATTNLLFLSLTPPYSPISKSGFKKILATINTFMKNKYPQFFDDRYVDSIDKISAHILRHTWAYMMLKSSYETNINTGKDKNEAMNHAMENLRKLAGWSLNSSMPYLYANRFISENANLSNIERIREINYA